MPLLFLRGDALFGSFITEPSVLMSTEIGLAE